MTTPDLSDGCPRCGGGLEVKSSSEVSCLNPSCATCWMDVRTWQRECIARDLAGTRKMKVGPEYVTDQLTTDITELVALVEYVTYENVLKNLRVAIEGRQTASYRAKNGAASTASEVKALQSMYGWALKQSEKYGKEDDDSIF